MHIMTFSERPYFHVSEDDIIANQNSYFGLANMGDTGFDPAKGHVLYHEYFDERIYAEELGFDGVMLNEHHQTPFCMGAVMDVEAAVLARITKKVKIVLLGNPLPAARAASRLPTISTRHITASGLMKRTTSSSRRGPRPDRGVTKASIITIAS